MRELGAALVVLRLYLPTRRILATVRCLRQAKALAADLARTWIKGDGSDPATWT